MTIEMRGATSKDFSNIGDITVEAYRRFASRLKVENWQKMRQSLSKVNQTARDAQFIVAEVEGQIVGAIAYCALGNSNPKFFDSGCSSLRLLALTPSYQGQGIGKLLTKEGIRRAKQDHAECLDCTLVNS
ncbi:MAG: GNAT family N-acetyltransferase [Cyanobacteria bacterium P01_E01_bin.35]